MNIYTQVWNKYLPVIRILLKRSASAEQSMGLNRIDFEKGSRSRKPACSFNIELVEGRFKTVSQSAPAKEDEVSKTLLRQNNYVISLNSDFQLKIRNNTSASKPSDEGKNGADPSGESS